MPLAVEVHPLAADEAEAAEQWYRERNATAAARFRRELDRVVELIAERPDAAPPYIGSTRRFLLRRFPFFVVYRVFDRHVQVVAVRTLGGDQVTGFSADCSWLETRTLSSTSVPSCELVGAH